MALWGRRSAGTAVREGLATLLSKCGIRICTIKPGARAGEETAVILGDMTKIDAGAYVVPHFKDCASDGGVGAAVYRSGAARGWKEYAQIADSLRTAGREVPWGDCTMTASGGGKSQYLLNVVSVGSRGFEEESQVVTISVFNALIKAREANIDSVVIPALGTGIIGNLTSAQSARAIFGAVEHFRSLHPDAFPQKVIVAIYGDTRAFESFSRIMQVGANSPEAIALASGPGRAFDPVRWLTEVGDRISIKS